MVGRLSEPPLGQARESSQPSGSTRRTEVCLRDAPVSRAPSLTRRTSTVRAVTEVPKITTHPGAWALRTLGPMAPCSQAMLRLWGSAAVGPLPTMRQWHPHSPFWRPKPPQGIADAPRGQNPAQEALRAAGAPGQEAPGPQLVHPGKSSWVTGAHLHGTHSGARSLWSPSGATQGALSRPRSPEGTFPAGRSPLCGQPRQVPTQIRTPHGFTPACTNTTPYETQPRPHTLPVPGSQPGHDQQGQEWVSRLLHRSPWTSSSPRVTGQDRALVPTSPPTGLGLSTRVHLLPASAGLDQPRHEGATS